jgi:hypothetical protein
MKNVYELIWEGQPRVEPLARTRTLPSQPADTPANKIYGGVDLGFIDWSGEKPVAGDQVIILADGARKVALSGSNVPAMRAPTFGGSCKCNCKGTAGTIFWGNPIQTGPYLLIMDPTGVIKQALNPSQIYRIAGIAVDSASPYTLYVLDDRTRLDNFRTDASPDDQIAGTSTYALHTFTQSGGTYSWASVTEMADPGLSSEPFFFSEIDWVTNSAADGQLDDPPAAYPTNCMSVINGLLYITMSIRPAHYLTFSGGAFTTHNLTLGGTNYNKGLRGMILTGLEKPGKAVLRYVLAWWGYGGHAADGSGGYEILQFNEANEITKRLSDDTAMKSPTALVIVCNRLLVLNSNWYGRTESGGSGDLNGSFIQSGTPPT